MRPLRIGLAQLNPTVGDLDGNFERAAAAIARARAAGVDLLALPEMALAGYPPEDLLLQPAFLERLEARTRELAALSAGLTVVVGTIERDGGLYNIAAVLHDGQPAGRYRKRRLPNYGVFDERRYFTPGESNLVFAREGLVFGVSICEDIWYTGGPVEEQAARGGAGLLINISASPYHAGKSADRLEMLRARAVDNRAVVAYVNLLGGQDELLFDGGSYIVDASGRPLAGGVLFEEALLLADLDPAAPAATRGPAAAAGLPRIELAPVAAAGPRPAPPPAAVAPSRPLAAEVYDALVLGTRDYVRKNGFAGVVLGLSGGVDSSLTATIAVDALGADRVVGVSMPSRYTSDASNEDAAALARALGIRLEVIPIAEVAAAYERALAPVFAGRGPDITEENLQARIRGNDLMALSNKFGWLVLTTGNKSEFSTGYTTLYGDMAGGFAVLKDVYKTMVYELARHRNARGAVIPERVLTRPPTAELKPGQTDQDTLPPYDVLDAILRLYVEEDRPAAEIAAAGHDPATVARVLRMVDQAEYKRRQSPPGVKITPRAFGKDRRLPITNRWRG